MEICKLEHIHKDYRMGEIVTPLKDICLTVNQGDFIAVEGPSGIGKSTLLYVMGTLLQSDEGTYTYGGKDISKFNDAQKSEFRAKKIGFLFQDSTMIQALTLRENLIFTQGVGGCRKDLKKVDELLYLFGLEDRAIVEEYYARLQQRHPESLDCAPLLALNEQRGNPKKPHCDALVYECIELCEAMLKEQGKLTD